MVELSITVLHFNRWDLTRDCLASIDAQDIPCSSEKVLVDNGSQYQLGHSIHEKGYLAYEGLEHWRYVRYDDNRGHIVGQNRCFESAQGEWVLFVANDVRLQSGCLKTLWYGSWQWYNSDGNFVLFQPTLLTPSGKCDNRGLLWMWPGYGVSNRQAHLWHPSSFTSSCYLLPKRIWERVGGFDERLATSHEDIELSLRCRRSLNARPYVVQEALATHIGNATLRHQPSHTRAAFHRDRVYVIKKHYTSVDKWCRLLVINIIDWMRYLAVQMLDHLPHPPQWPQRSA